MSSLAGKLKSQHTLIVTGVDELFSRHIASIFSREPVIAYAEDFDKSAPDMNHFDVCTWHETILCIDDLHRIWYLQYGKLSISSIPRVQIWVGVWNFAQ